MPITYPHQPALSGQGVILSASVSEPIRVKSHLNLTDISLIATFAALLAALSLVPAISVAAVPVPITLQTLGVYLTGTVLGAKRGVLSVLLYLAVGFAGAPIFAQGWAGVGILATPSAGYLVAFPLVAAFAGWLTQLFRRDNGLGRMAISTFLACVISSLLILHPAGIIGMALRLKIPLLEAATLDLVFVPGDLIKCAVAAVVTASVARAFPDLLRS